MPLSCAMHRLTLCGNFWLALVRPGFGSAQLSVGWRLAAARSGAALLVPCGYYSGRLGDCNLYGFNIGVVPAYRGMPWFRIDLPRVLEWLMREHGRGRPAPLSERRRRGADGRRGRARQMPLR